MRLINHSLLKQVISFYFEAKRKFYQLLFSNIVLGKGVRIKGLLRVKGPVRLIIGESSWIGKGVLIEGRGSVIIGKNVSLNGAWIGCDTAISIGDDCLISDCFIIDTNFHNLEPHLRHCPPEPKVTAPIIIERNVWVGARATIMKGVHIGEDSVIGLGSVIRKPVPAGVVVIGDPQQIVKYFDHASASQPGA